ncbi:GNAT family N-acetyltransferase [Dysgonomonas sp. ZJ279]|uniref:GNAT family N-acetyltransferase n=1 Tax=Dysgonomonas sp. ZJ279 TaxID=2709796 RepID=UPI0013EC4C13|nr:GNAT family N-acetyltransferase [Dysgonomonas sp. ZJ279]
MEIKLYKPEYKTEWDNFIRNSKNGTFLFCRDFMEYHSDRFNDHSFMFYIDNNLIAVMAGHLKEQIFYTHQGLTYGGLIMGDKITTVDTLSIFEHITITLRQQGIKKIIYKTIPHIYHLSPAEEDLYALFRNNAVLIERNISSTILLSNKIEYSDSRKRGLKKAEKNNLRIGLSNDLRSFWKILGDNLKGKYCTKPVHTLEEISYLQSNFPQEIHLFSALNTKNEIIAGCVIFEMKNLIHVQYTAGTEEGKDCGAIDLLIDYIINVAYPHKTYFDYGISTENNGAYLNENLIYQKEGFGARGTVYDIYSIEL